MFMLALFLLFEPLFVISIAFKHTQHQRPNDLRGSYNTMRWPLPVSDHHVPMPPNRSSHDHHLLQLHVPPGGELMCTYEWTGRFWASQMKLSPDAR